MSNDDRDFRDIQRSKMAEGLKEEARIRGLIAVFERDSYRLAAAILIFAGALCVWLASIGTSALLIVSISQVAIFLAWLIATRERSRFDYEDRRGTLERTIDEIRTERKRGT